MGRRLFFIYISLAITIRLAWVWFYPFIVDELNVWNVFHDAHGFLSFWRNFIKYDTHQPIFYLFWYPLFNSFWGQFVLRLPSVVSFVGSIWIWNKLFPYGDEKNQVPWGLFLFSPFLLMYSSFFLPYSFLIFFSLLNYWAFLSWEKTQQKKELGLFILSSLLLIFTHYYGALQALLMTAYLIYGSKRVVVKAGFLGILFVLFGALVFFSDFLNDFGAVHTYRKVPTLFNVLGSINLLNGGRYLSILLLVLFVIKQKWKNLFSREVLFIFVVLAIAYGKSKYISPSFEARYLLILIYPLYRLFVGFEIRYIVPIFTIVGVFSLYQLQNTFGASFVTKYEQVPRTNEGVGLFITPCPKFYFPSSNYLCKDYYQNYEQMTAGANQFIVHKDHYFFFKRLVRNSECERMQEPGLYSCRLQVK